MNDGPALLAARTAWIEALVWSLPGLIPLGALWVLGSIDVHEALIGIPCALAIGMAIAWWRRGQLAPLLFWARALQEGAPTLGPLPESFLHDEILRALRALERDNRQLRAQAAASDQLQRSLVDAVPDPVLIVDARGYVRTANPTAVQHFNEELVGRPLGRFLRDPGILAAIDSAIRAEVSSTVSFTPLRDRTRRYTCGIHPMPTGDGSPRAILSLRETSEQVAIERMRSDFIANASHELRTPLTALAGFVETLKGPAKDDEAARIMFLDIMAAEAARMVRLIDDLLSLSRLEAEAHRSPQEAVKLHQVVASALAGLEPQIEKYHAAVEVAVPDDLPQLRGDPDQLQQVVTNLVDNAMKYGRPGTPVRVEAELLTPAGDGAGPLAGRSAVCLSVIDQGEGIPAAHISRLTERFYRVDKSRSRRAGGTGLGLAICKHIVKRHGGHLNVDSKPGVGSRFSVFIPAP